MVNPEEGWVSGQQRGISGRLGPSRTTLKPKPPSERSFNVGDNLSLEVHSTALASFRAHAHRDDYV